MTIIDAALEVACHFEALGVRDVLEGSLAASVHGEPRSTRDVDIAAELREEHAPGLVTRLGERWYADEIAILEAIGRRSSFNLLRLVDPELRLSTRAEASKCSERGTETGGNCPVSVHGTLGVPCRSSSYARRSPARTWPLRPRSSSAT